MSTARRLWLMAIACCACLVWLAASAAAEDRVEQARRADRISSSLMSPFCPGRTLADCPRAGEWREDIRGWVHQGLSNEEIEARLAKRAPGFNLSGGPKSTAGRVVPLLLGLLSLGVLVLVVRALLRRRQVDQPAVEASQAQDAALDAELDRELQELE